MYCFGDNDEGQLGFPASPWNALSPAAVNVGVAQVAVTTPSVPGIPGFSQFGVGDQFTCGIYTVPTTSGTAPSYGAPTSAGNIACWGFTEGVIATTSTPTLLHCVIFAKRRGRLLPEHRGEPLVAAADARSLTKTALPFITPLPNRIGTAFELPANSFAGAPHRAKLEAVMPKLKTNKAASKRFKITGSGRVRRSKSGCNHNMQEKVAHASAACEPTTWSTKRWRST